MIHKSKLVCLTVAAALTLSLFTGCSSQTTTAVNPTSPTDQTTENVETDTGSLVIAEQGIFSAGGITVTSEGTFDPENQWEETGQVRLSMWIMKCTLSDSRR